MIYNFYYLNPFRGICNIIKYEYEQEFLLNICSCPILFQQTSIYMTEIKVHFWPEGRKDKRVKHNIFILYFLRLLFGMTP